MHKEIQKIVKLDELPNVPYFPTAISEGIKEELQNTGVEFKEDEHAVYVRIQKGNPKRKFIIDAHLDHPGFAINSNGDVVEIGSIHGSSSVHHISSGSQHPVRYYSDTGEFLGKGLLTDPHRDRKGLSIDSDLPPNTQVVIDVETGIEKGSVMLRSVDNLAAAAVCLNLIETFISLDTENIDATFMFTKLEEVSQLSAVGIALEGTTPFGKIDKSTHFIVLEAGPWGSQVQSTKHNELAMAISENDIPLAALNSSNQTINIMNAAATNAGHKLPQLNITSNSNAIAYSLVGRFPNVACLIANNKNRHNIDEEGNFAPEIISMKAVEQMRDIVLQTILDDNDFSDNNSKVIDQPTQKLTEQKRKQLIRTFRWAKERLKAGHLYPKNPQEKVLFSLSSLSARLPV